MEQIIKTYIGMFFLIATIAIGINFIYASIVSRNANNLANDFAYKITRYDHSLSTALITWKFTKDKK